MAYTLTYSDDAWRQLQSLNRYYRNLVQGAIEHQLPREPTIETRNRKFLHPNLLGADWELRVPPYRVYYRVEEEVMVVEIVAIGYKPRSDVFINGERVDL